MFDKYEMLLATFAVVGQEMPDLGIKAMVSDLEGYDDEALAFALQRCRKELKRITLSDIIERVHGEHPGPEEAWAIMGPTISNERVSVAATQPMLTAYGVACKLGGDKVAGRLAFKEVYQRCVSEDRAAGKRPTWIASLGADSSGREEAQKKAESLNIAAKKSMPRLAAEEMRQLPPKSYKLII